MEFFIEKQLYIVLNFLFLGLIFGAAYDIIRILHVICGIASYSDETRGMVRSRASFALFFVFDFAYIISAILVFSFFVYSMNSGSFRWFTLFAAVAGFGAYYFTVGRLVMFFSEAVVRFIRRVVYIAVVKPLMFIGGLISKGVYAVYSRTIGRLVQLVLNQFMLRQTKRFMRETEFDIRFSVNDEEGLG